MPVPCEPRSTGRHLLRDDAFIALRAAIVEGVLEPGERLIDAELTRWLGISRTPIREAIARLEQSGLVVTTPGRSTVVSPVDVRAIRDAQEMVASLHELTVREAVPLLGERHLDEMRDANAAFAEALASGDVSAAIAADDNFHAVPVDAYANRAVRVALDQHTPLLRRMERQRFSSLTGRASVAQHERIVDLARSGDAVGAAHETRLNWLTLRPALDDTDS